MQSSDEILQGILGGRKKKSPKRSPKRKSRLRAKKSPPRHLKGGNSISQERPWSALDAILHTPRAALDVTGMLLTSVVDNRLTMKKPQLK